MRSWPSGGSRPTDRVLRDTPDPVPSELAALVIRLLNGGLPAVARMSLIVVDIRDVSHEDIVAREMALIKVRTTTLNQVDEPVQVMIANLVVLRRPGSSASAIQGRG